MKIALVHNFYQQRGGEDNVVEQEKSLLEKAGHQVVCFFTSNDSLKKMPAWKQLSCLIWNRRERKRFQTWLTEQNCDLVHMHNLFPYLSPALLGVPHRLALPLVVTLHNYRLACAAAIFFHHGKVCTRCLKNSLMLPAIYYGCYRQSRLLSFAVVCSLLWHRLLRSWQRHVDVFFVFQERQRQLLSAAGLAEKRLQIKANSVATQVVRSFTKGDFLSNFAHDFLLVGRISPEKGSLELIRWWAKQQHKHKLTIAGSSDDQQVRAELEKFNQKKNICYLGSITQENVSFLMSKSRYLIFPSLWFEGMPMVILEALSAGLPILARQLGASLTLIKEGENGFFFKNEAQLNSLLAHLMSIDEKDYRQLVKNCQERHSQYFSHQVNLKNLETCYEGLQKDNPCH